MIKSMFKCDKCGHASHHGVMQCLSITRRGYYTLDEAKKYYSVSIESPVHLCMSLNIHDITYEKTWQMVNRQITTTINRPIYGEDTVERKSVKKTRRIKKSRQIQRTKQGQRYKQFTERQWMGSPKGIVSNGYVTYSKWVPETETYWANEDYYEPEEYWENEIVRTKNIIGYEPYTETHTVRNPVTVMKYGVWFTCSCTTCRCADHYSFGQKLRKSLCCASNVWDDT